MTFRFQSSELLQNLGNSSKGRPEAFRNFSPQSPLPFSTRLFSNLLSYTISYSGCTVFLLSTVWLLGDETSSVVIPHHGPGLLRIGCAVLHHSYPGPNKKRLSCSFPNNLSSQGPLLGPSWLRKPESLTQSVFFEAPGVLERPEKREGPQSTEAQRRPSGIFG